MDLADTSAWWRVRRAEALDERFQARLQEGWIATCDMVRLELLHSVRDADEFARERDRLARLPDCPIDRAAWRRALDVYERLAAPGGMRHRAVKHADLLIAAAAELAGATVLHYDEDYDLIAAVTGQPTAWIAPRGSL